MRRILVVLLIAAPLRAQVLRAPGLDAVASAPSAAAPLAASVSAVFAPALAPSLTAAPIADLLAAAPVPAAAAVFAAVPAAPSAAAALPVLRGAASWTPSARPTSGESLRADAGAPFGESFFGTPAAVETDVSAPETTASGLRPAAPRAVARPSDSPPTPSAPEPKPFFIRHYKLLRFFVAPILGRIYNIDMHGWERLPEGPVLIVPNHVTYMDPLLISFAANRPMRFLTYRGIYEISGLRWLFRALGALPISASDPKSVTAATLERARRLLESGESVVIFPEGHLTYDGKLDAFHHGFERVAASETAPVIPAGVVGMWGSALSHRPGSSPLRSLLEFLRGRRRVSVRLGSALSRVDAESARSAVAALLDKRP